MEKIIKPDISTIPTLSELKKNFVQWGQDFEKHLKKGGKSSDFTFNKQKGLYNEIRHQLSLITAAHCTFCDSYPIPTISKETLEHYYPKKEFPLKAYDWVNLFYCCDKCQSEANKVKFQETLKPDTNDYQFAACFYFDLESGKLQVLENLETDNLELFNKANAFLIRYGSNTSSRAMARKRTYKDIENHFIAQKETNDNRERDDFPYRCVYDYYTYRQSVKVHNI